MSKTKSNIVSKSIPEVERAVNDIARPMRWDSAEAIAKKFVKQNLDMWTKLTKDLFATIRAISAGESLTYETLLRHERKKGFGFPYNIAEDKEGHLKLVQKKADPTPQDLRDMIIKLQEYLRPDQISAIENLFDTYSTEYFNSQNPNDRQGIWGKSIPKIFEDGFNQALENLEKNAKATGNLGKLKESEDIGFDPESILTRGYYNDVYKLVTSKISIAAKGEVLKAIADGLENGQNWKEISDNIYEKVGSGYRYHWQRLVRTEMTQIYYKSFVERYEKTGVEYVRLSTSMGACPICTGLKAYYKLGNEPALTASTHPNCRCVYVPYFRLPKGAKVRK